MILADTGPLVALCNQRDSHYEAVTRTFGGLRDPMLTTEACMGEALHLLQRAQGWLAQKALWNLVRIGALSIHRSEQADSLRAADYMERFRDLPCDYADATLLVAAEETGLRQIFTIDPHFNAYRLRSGEALNAVP